MPPAGGAQRTVRGVTITLAVCSPPGLFSGPFRLRVAFRIHQIKVVHHPYLRVGGSFSFVSNPEDFQIIILADIHGELTLCSAVFLDSLCFDSFNSHNRPYEVGAPFSGEETGGSRGH